MPPAVHVMAGLVRRIARPRMCWRRGLQRAWLAMRAGAIVAVACLALAAAAPAALTVIARRRRTVAATPAAQPDPAPQQETADR